jgi:hypothetical protein
MSTAPGMSERICLWLFPLLSARKLVILLLRFFQAAWSNKKQKFDVYVHFVYFHVSIRACTLVQVRVVFVKVYVFTYMSMIISCYINMNVNLDMDMDMVAERIWT